MTPATETRVELRPPVGTGEMVFVLLECARDMRTITYRELSRLSDLAPSGIGAHRPLGFIRDELCRRHDLPWLSALAVSASDMRPGDNWLPPDHPLRADTWTPAQEELWRAMVARVYAYDWRSINLPLWLKGELRLVQPVR